MNRPKIIAIAASALAAVSLTGAAVDHARTHSTLADARRKTASADHRAQQAEARPPKLVTKTVTKTVDKPVFGRSTLLGAYAATRCAPTRSSSSPCATRWNTATSTT